MELFKTEIDSLRKSLKENQEEVMTFYFSSTHMLIFQDGESRDNC